MPMTPLLADSPALQRGELAALSSTEPAIRLSRAPSPASALESDSRIVARSLAVNARRDEAWRLSLRLPSPAKPGARTRSLSPCPSPSLMGFATPSPARSLAGGRSRAVIAKGTPSAVSTVAPTSAEPAVPISPKPSVFTLAARGLLQDSAFTAKGRIDLASEEAELSEAPQPPGLNASVAAGKTPPFSGPVGPQAPAATAADDADILDIPISPEIAVKSGSPAAIDVCGPTIDSATSASPTETNAAISAVQEALRRAQSVLVRLQAQQARPQLQLNRRANASAQRPVSTAVLPVGQEIVLAPSAQTLSAALIESPGASALAGPAGLATKVPAPGTETTLAAIKHLPTPLVSIATLESPSSEPLLQPPASFVAADISVEERVPASSNAAPQTEAQIVDCAIASVPAHASPALPDPVPHLSSRRNSANGIDHDVLTLAAAATAAAHSAAIGAISNSARSRSSSLDERAAAASGAAAMPVGERSSGDTHALSALQSARLALARAMAALESSSDDGDDADCSGSVARVSATLSAVPPLPGFSSAPAIRESGPMPQSKPAHAVGVLGAGIGREVAITRSFPGVRTPLFDPQLSRAGPAFMSASAASASAAAAAAEAVVVAAASAAMRERVTLARGAATPLTPPPVRTAKGEQKVLALRPMPAVVPASPEHVDVEVLVPGKGLVVFSKAELERLGVSIPVDADENGRVRE